MNVCLSDGLIQSTVTATVSYMCLCELKDGLTCLTAVEVVLLYVYISHEWDTWLSFTCGVEQMEVCTDLISPCPQTSVFHSRLFRAWWNRIAMAFNQKYGESLFCCYVTLADGTFIFIAIVGLFNGGHISCYWSKLLYQLFSSRAVQHWALKAWMI